GARGYTRAGGILQVRGEAPPVGNLEDAGLAHDREGSPARARLTHGRARKDRPGHAATDLSAARRHRADRRRGAGDAFSLRSVLRQQPCRYAAYLGLGTRDWGLGTGARDWKLSQSPPSPGTNHESRVARRHSWLA